MIEYRIVNKGIANGYLFQKRLSNLNWHTIKESDNENTILALASMFVKLGGIVYDYAGYQIIK